MPQEPEKVTLVELQKMIKAIKTNKYYAQKMVVDNITFASRKEARRYQHLKLCLSAGIIKDLVLQPKYSFEHNGLEITTYRPDFRYYDREKRKEIVEDVKSKATRTRDYLIRVRCMKAWFDIDVIEV